MTLSVRFCLSYDPLNWDFIALKMGNISRRKRIVDTNIVSDVTSMCQSVITRFSYNFYDMTLSTITGMSYDKRSYINEKCNSVGILLPFQFHSLYIVEP